MGYCGFVRMVVRPDRGVFAVGGRRIAFWVVVDYEGREWRMMELGEDRVLKSCDGTRHANLDEKRGVVAW
jgi:hypothetical protein